MFEIKFLIECFNDGDNPEWEDLVDIIENKIKRKITPEESEWIFLNFDPVSIDECDTGIY